MRFVISGAAVCSATGDPHYKTFDGKRYNFMGACEYVLAKDLEEKFVILQDNEPCGKRKATCTNAVTVKIQGMTIYLRRGENVQVNDTEIALPYANQGMFLFPILQSFSKVVGKPYILDRKCTCFNEKSLKV